MYSPITRAGAGPAVAIEATVTRTSDRELTASFLPSTVGASTTGRSAGS